MLENLVKRKNAFVRLKEWDDDRRMRSEGIRAKIDNLFTTTNRLSLESSESIKWVIAVFEERAKLDLSYARGLCFLAGDSCTSQTKTVNRQKSNVLNEKPAHISKLARTVEDLILDHSRRTHQNSEFVAAMIKESVHPQEIEYKANLSTLNHQITIEIKNADCDADRCENAWKQHEIVFKKLEHELMAEDAGEDETRLRHARKDSWLSERQFLETALKMMRSLERLVTQSQQYVKSVMEIEKKRALWIRGVSTTLIAQLHQTQSSICDQTEQAQILSDNSHECVFLQEITRFLGVTQEDSKIQDVWSPKSRKIPHFRECADLLEMEAAPLGVSSIVKQTKAERQSGIFKSWKPCFLILSSDRFVHVMEKESDLLPRITLDADFTRVRYHPVTNTNNNCGLLELQEFRKSGVLTRLTGSKKYLFKIASEPELADWAHVIKNYRSNELDSAMLSSFVIESAPPSMVVDSSPDEGPVTSATSLRVDSVNENDEVMEADFDDKAQDIESNSSDDNVYTESHPVIIYDNKVDTPTKDLNPETSAAIFPSPFSSIINDNSPQNDQSDKSSTNPFEDN
eukprot:GHVL01024098.1.p1 GENE.GHVL01024098.1~~GHVL01024098.1.p1  ORF type:complete len:571 (+),score=114.45 GHVL01024098.1:18-1730(+)